MDRREFLTRLGLCAAAGVAIGACGPADPESSSTFCSQPTTDPPDEWVPIVFDEHPELSDVGDHLAIDRPDDYLKVHVVHYADGCFLVAARLCTHGACELDVSEIATTGAEDTPFECPCHGSQFGPDGRVVRGPATDPIGIFAVRTTEEALWIRPPSID